MNSEISTHQLADFVNHTCRAFDLLVRAEILRVNGVLVNGNNFLLRAGNVAAFFSLRDDDEALFLCSYLDETGMKYFSFSKKSLVEAKVKQGWSGSLIYITDCEGQTVDIACFELRALV